MPVYACVYSLSGEGVYHGLGHHLVPAAVAVGSSSNLLRMCTRRRLPVFPICVLHLGRCAGCLCVFLPVGGALGLVNTDRRHRLRGGKRPGV